jgi:hypothetical protein
MANLLHCSRRGQENHVRFVKFIFGVAADIQDSYLEASFDWISSSSLWASEPAFFAPAETAPFVSNVSAISACGRASLYRP